jgi:aminoglycoside phosphotransferase (APT) family kinase protein
MEYARQHGYPVPAVDELSDDGTNLVMERLDGSSMVAVLDKQPWTLKRQGTVLADLHQRLHQIPAPDWLPVAPCGSGDRLVHLDLHPLNVMLTSKGPVVIDWANAARGDPAYDVADAWVLFATADAPGNSLERSLAAVARRIFLRNFLGDLDADAARAVIPAAVGHRLTDRNMTESEKERMRRLSAWSASGRPGPPRWGLRRAAP